MANKLFKSLILSFFAFSFSISSALSVELYLPQRGDPLRKELLDSIRPRVETEMRTRVQFVVDRIAIMGECAFVAATPQHKDGTPISIEITRFADDRDFMDGLTTYSLLIHRNKRWYEVAFVTGPTDVAFATWPKDYLCPAKLFGLE